MRGLRHLSGTLESCWSQSQMKTYCLNLASNTDFTKHLQPETEYDRSAFEGLKLGATVYPRRFQTICDNCILGD
ncbi:hypothetical protein FQN52_008014 [Onygenales sp. PD_12]|nr:hypothetical protein FQN52_008014 [Onygenales sp. PD_12]